MSASENRKDELAARALSRLSDPPLPEGLAARITARATAVPQIGTVAPGDRVAAVPPAIAPASPVVPVLASRRRWPFYAAASFAAVALLLAGILAGLTDRREGAPALAERDKAAPLSRAPKSQAPAEFVEAAAPAPEATKSTKNAAPATAPATGLPVPATTPPAQPATNNEPAEAVKPVEEGNQPERLAHTGPQAGPQGAAPGGSTSMPVYGPPAPSGLGIVGSTGGPTSFPDEAGKKGRPPRATSPGPPPSSLPGSSAPRGTGPRL